MHLNYISYVKNTWELIFNIKMALADKYIVRELIKEGDIHIERLLRDENNNSTETMVESFENSIQYDAEFSGTTYHFSLPLVSHFLRLFYQQNYF